jgi:APA family basic amino acid/polyamine antiporter
MARHRDLPNWLSAVHPRYRVPHHAEMALAVVVSILVLTTDLRGVIGFSSFGVLSYYAIANVAAFTQPTAERRWPRGLNLLGVLGCLALVATLPLTAVIAGIVMLAAGLIGRLLVQRLRHRRHQQPSPP